MRRRQHRSISPARQDHDCSVGIPLTDTTKPPTPWAGVSPLPIVPGTRLFRPWPTPPGVTAPAAGVGIAVGDERRAVGAALDRAGQEPVSADVPVDRLPYEVLARPAAAAGLGSGARGFDRAAAH